MRERVTAARSARLATVGEDGQPHLVPVVFALNGPLAWIAVDAKPKRTRDLARIRNIRARPKVSLLVDHYEEDWSRLWWVRLDGDGRVLPPSRWQGPIDLLRAKYRQYDTAPPEGPVIEIRIHTWRGWAGTQD
ncbi:MAG TPA: TIGR03668 family PPOX class F420-dependent oxidoreductase [Euzebyales bacterium]|nr:TIGR03668 family PPOX class F420-dependent oxidoreductase [Euzebyales bacterium]